MSAGSEDPVSPTGQLKARLYAEQVAMLYRFSPFALLWAFTGSVLISLVLRDFLPPWQNLLWFVALLLFNLTRLAVWGLYLRAKPTVEQAPFWGRCYVLSTFGAGLVWGLLDSGLMALSGPLAEVQLAAVLIAILGIGVFTLFPFYPAFLAFAVAVALPPTAFLLRKPYPENLSGITLLLFLVIVLLGCRRLSRSNAASIQLRLESEDLAQQKIRQNLELLDLVAERQRAAQAERLAKEQAESANRTKTEFLATLSHELRTPLSVVLGFTHLLSTTDLTTEQRDYSDAISRAGRSLLQQINDLLDLSKIEAGKMDLEAIPFDLGAVAREVVALLAPKASEKALSLGLELEPGLPVALEGDPARLKQVLLNLADNALKFTERGGVRIQIARQGPQFLRVAIIDTGIGIDADTQPLLFSKFTQADSSTTRRYGGTGLGLAISKRLVELMGGEIGVESELGRGSTFWFTFLAKPTTLQPPRREEPLEDLPELDRAAPLRVLVADDDVTNQRVASLFLGKLGCVVDCAANGREAVACFSRHPYELVVMDCYMPEMDGFEATAAIRRLGPRGARVPIIALSASAMDEDRQKCMAAGMDEFMTKPIEVEALRRMLAKWG